MMAKQMDLVQFSTISSMLEQHLQSANYQILQHNGQRIYAPSQSSGIAPPPKGTEIFIGNLPPDVYENEIISLFSATGAIYSLRLMTDFFGRNRGYAFISYFVQEHAFNAVTTFNNYKMRNKTKISVSMSVDNRRLFMGNIPRSMSAEELKAMLVNYVDGIVNVISYREPKNQDINRGFVFVEFESHRLAAIARRQLAPGNLNIWSQTIFVDWAEPLPLVNPEIMKQVTKLYLSNLPIDLTIDELKLVLQKLVGSEHILKVHKINDYAFVHFTIRKFAEEAKKILIGLVLMNQRIEVEWARPIEYSKTNRVNKSPDNFCKSVPPNMRRMVLNSIHSRKSGGPSGLGSAKNGRISILDECKI